MNFPTQGVKKKAIFLLSRRTGSKPYPPTSRRYVYRKIYQNNRYSPLLEKESRLTTRITQRDNGTNPLDSGLD